MSDKTYTAMVADGRRRFAFDSAPRHQRDRLQLEVAGELVAGNVRACLPEALNPPTQWGHRPLADGIATVAAMGHVAVRQFDGARALAGLLGGYGSQALKALAPDSLPLLT